MTELKKILRQSVAQLQETSPSAQLDAEVLLAFVLKKSRTFLHTHPEAQLTPKQSQEFMTLITQRLTGVPIAYLTQQREFWSLPIRVSPATLIPRPETEQLVELTLALLPDHTHATILDLGSGSGAIALALAAERPAWQLIAAEISLEALAIIQENAACLHIPNIRSYHSNWFTEIPAMRFDAIVSNPPYIAEGDPHLTMGDVRFEPKHALISGASGLDDLYHIIEQSHARLNPGGILLLEHGYNQGQAVREWLAKNHYQNIQSWPDWQGHERVSGGWRSQI